MDIPYSIYNYVWLSTYLTSSKVIAYYMLLATPACNACAYPLAAMKQLRAGYLRAGTT